MKLFAPALIFCGAAAFGQSPQVPPKMQFAGMTLTIRDDARREIQKDVDALTQSPKHFNIKVERAKTYFPIVEKIFAEEKLPDDFKYLCLQESALIPDAVSSSNAVGFWQFKDFTAAEMGLRIDSEVDERMNIASSTRAAAQYLKKSNHYFNNWVYALQSYQMGAGGVMRAVGEKDLGSRHMEITSDTYWYVKKYLAHKVAFENSVSGKAALEVTRLNSVGGKSTHQLASETSIDEARLREFNKWIKGSRIPTDKEYAFLVPSGEVSSDFGVLATSAKAKTPVNVQVVVATENLEVNGVPVIRSVKGESIQALADRAHVGLKKFLKYNDMSIDQPILAGQLYFREAKKKRASEELYTLAKGEDLWVVSQRFGVQQKSLIRFNRLKSATAPSPGYTLYMKSQRPKGQESFAGEVAVLDEEESFNWDQSNTVVASVKAVRSTTYTKPATETTPLTTEEPATDEAASVTIHEVRSSDTLYSVARQYGVTIKELMEWNNKKDLSVSVGEKLKVHTH